MKKTIQILSNPKYLFLIDGLGALLTAFCLEFVLARLESVFGVPQKTSHFLSIIAFIFAIYSLLSYFFVRENWRFYLKIIAFANLTYCFTTIYLIFHFNKNITHLGMIYFLGEIIVILIIVFFELKTAFKRIS